MVTMQRSEHTTYLFNYSNQIGLDINNAIRLEKCMGKTAIPQTILNVFPYHKMSHIFCSVLSASIQ